MTLAAVLLLLAVEGASADVAAETARNVATIRAYMGVEYRLFSSNGGLEAYSAEQKIKTVFDRFFAEEVWCTQIGGPGEGFRVGPVPFQTCLMSDDRTWKNTILSNYEIKNIAADVDGGGRVFFTESAFDIGANGPDGREVPGTRTKMVEVMKLVFNGDGKIVEQHAYSDTFILGEVRKAAAAAAAGEVSHEGSSSLSSETRTVAAAGFSWRKEFVMGASLAGALALAAAALWNFLRPAATRSLAEPCLLG